MDSIALHIPVCFENISKISNSRRLMEIENLRKLVREIKVPMFISINGDCDQIWIDKVYRAVAWPGSYVKEVFHRENIGYQWGGFYDMFKMLTSNYDNHWTHMATLEVDCFLQPDWLEKCLDAEYSHIGMPPYRDHISPLSFPKDWNFSKTMGHTRGGFHFCRKSLLEKIDKQFGCFTEAKGCDLMIDGILHGEIGFCQKIEATGTGLHPIDDICYIMEYRPENLKKHKVLKFLPKKKAENIDQIISKDTNQTLNLQDEKKKKKLKKQRSEVLNPKDVRKALLKGQEKKQKPEARKKDGNKIQQKKMSRYRSERNKLNANQKKGRFHLGP